MENKVLNFIINIFNAIEDNKIIGAIRRGLVISIPLLMVSSIVIVVLNIPINSYQIFLNEFLGGSIKLILTYVTNGSLEIIALILLITISYSYGEMVDKTRFDCIIMSVVSVCSFIAFAGSEGTNSLTNIFNSLWLFTAIVVSVLASVIYVRVSSIKWFKLRTHFDGTDIYFNSSISAIIPSLLVILCFSSLNVLISNSFGVNSFQELFSRGINSLFGGMGRNLESAILFIFSMQFMWFFGIHGSNILDSVARGLFTSGLNTNMNLIAMMEAPTEIFTKTFFDTFVFMGGCGSIICLVIAILIKGKRRNTRQLATMSIIPVFFNISEFVVFGMPIVFNPILLIPFILTPIVLTIVSYVSLALGLVPLTISQVEWTTPIFFSGYAATKSLNGSVLQLINLCIGTLIYMPFVKVCDEVHISKVKNNINELTRMLQESEVAGEVPVLLQRKDKLSSIAIMLLEDLKSAIKNNELMLFYQPQVNSDGETIGVEALLRWEHSLGGYMYPPLIIALAKEANILDELGFIIIEKGCIAVNKLEKLFNASIKVSINVSVDQLNNPNFNKELKSLIDKYNIKPNSIGIELTEQIALSNSIAITNRLKAMKKLGVQVLMDDFGMGHSSMMYLQKNEFDVVKLDGSLIKDILSNDRSVDIIASIVQLSKSLGFSIIAEYVETKEQRDKLYEIGCSNYQGYLYSKPLDFDTLVEYIKTNMN
ncbi:MAG: EAL domain-containing protein [Clostridium sp.]|uniref:PTS sugar transporter subunit IIC/EAL domain-containing protein n=1 Tax=Clostridium sp. TaxID=1506 RepID=UPI00304624BD